MEQADALIEAVGWRRKKGLAQGVTLQDNEWDSRRELLAEVGLAGAGQAADDGQDRPDDGFRELPQTAGEVVGIRDNLDFSHIFNYKGFLERALGRGFEFVEFTELDSFFINFFLRETSPKLSEADSFL